jgi:hypothetical protein
MVKPLMTIIRAAITWGVTALPLKRNLVSRFMKEGAQETMKGALTAENEDIGTVGRRGTSMRGRHSTLTTSIMLY